MDFMKLFCRTITQVPAVIEGTETLFGKGAGEKKKQAALGIVGAAINITDAVTNKKIADAKGFTAGLSAIIDGVVLCLNASLWAKQ